MTPADVLEAAADALFVHGRATGRYQDEDGSMCVMGAINFAIVAADWEGLGLGCDACAALCLFVGQRLWEWNDRTEDDAEVIDTLKRCSKALREVES